MKIALVHDYLKEFGGAERVLEAFHEIWPEAPVYTSFVDFEGLGPHAERIKKWDVCTSWANNWLMKKLHSPLRFLAPWIWESFDFEGFDVVISSSGWYISRGIVTPPETLHICYLHHPPRHLYGYATAVEWKKYLPVRVYAHLVNFYLRQYDFLAAQRVDFFVANSEETKKRIEKFYRREATVIYPPVDLGIKKYESGIKRKRVNTSGVARRDSPEVNGKKYYLCVSRLARAKHLDLAIEACQRLCEPLKIVGKGRDEKNLKSKVKSQKSKVKFLGEISDEELATVYQGAKALIFPAEDEEFGIVPVEAMAHGVPVIAYRSGGVKETVVEGETGVFFDELNVDSLIEVVKQFNSLNHRTITTENCRQQAKKFSQERFERQIRKFVEEKWEEWNYEAI